jgi:hypothetical protein
MAFNKIKPTSDDDYQAYSNYIAKLAAIASPGDPPATPFRTWFFWKYGAFPAETRVDDRTARQAA